jgi:26S proteasome non-ATPase regulatory subunit 10
MDSSDDRFPLHTAAREGRPTVAEGLLKNDPKLSKRKDDDGRYPIHWAASANNLDTVLLLANQKGFDADVQDESGWTPLMIAASVPDGEAVVKLLLQKDADVNQKNSSGQTALHFVASKKNLDVARLLIENKASTRVRDRRGQFPIHRAAAVGSGPMVSLLLKNRSPLDATDNEGYTPLHHAVAEGHGMFPFAHRPPLSSFSHVVLPKTLCLAQLFLLTLSLVASLLHRLGDVAVLLLKEGADFTLKTAAEETALDLAPDKEVQLSSLHFATRFQATDPDKTCRFVNTSCKEPRGKVSRCHRRCRQAGRQAGRIPQPQKVHEEKNDQKHQNNMMLMMCVHVASVSFISC